MSEEIKDEGVEVKSPSAKNAEDLTKVLAGFTNAVNELKESKKTAEEQKSEVDKMKAEMSTLLETVEKERSAAAERKTIVTDEAATKKIGYDVKDIFQTTDMKDQSFDELLVQKEGSISLKSMQSRASDIYLIGKILAGRTGHAVESIIPRLKSYKNFMADTEEVRKAMSIGSGEAGFDWIPTGFSSDLIEIFHLQLVLANMHPNFTIPAKLGSWKIPGTSSDLKAFRTTATASDTPTKFKASTRSTRNVTFTPEKLAAATVFDIELEEDSIIPVLPNLKVNIAQALVRATEDTIINGDTALTQDNTDMHGDSLTVESPAAMWDGYRKVISTNGNTRNSAGGGASYGAMITCMRNMGKYAISPRDLAWVTGPNGYFDALMSMPETKTQDLFGPQAILQRGEIAKIFGIPIILSEQERQDLKTTTGVSGGASSGYNDTSVQLVWKPGFAFGSKRQITVDSAKIPRTDAIEVWSTARMDFQALYSAGETIIGEVTNVA